MKTKYIPQLLADRMLAIMNRIKRKYPNVLFDVVADIEYDTVYSGKEPEEAIDAMDGIDSDFGLNCYDGDLDHPLGWFYLTPYEIDGGPINDYDASEFCNWALDN